MNRLDQLVKKYQINTIAPTIFLSGAMTGLSKEEQTSWRNNLKEMFGGHYDFIDPTVFNAEDEDKDTQQMGFEYDICGIINCDYMIVNLNKIETSVGTCQEIMLAWLLDKYIIGFYENVDLVKELHPWIENKLSTKFKNRKILEMYLTIEYYKKWGKK